MRTRAFASFVAILMTASVHAQTNSQVPYTARAYNPAHPEAWREAEARQALDGSEEANQRWIRTVLDLSLERLRYLSDVMPANCVMIHSNRHNILEQIETADLVVGAVLIPGAKAPKLVRREDLKLMQPGAVIVDVAIDQGGCVETIHATAAYRRHATSVLVARAARRALENAA